MRLRIRTRSLPLAPSGKPSGADDVEVQFRLSLGGVGPEVGAEHAETGQEGGIGRAGEAKLGRRDVVAVRIRPEFDPDGRNRRCRFSGPFCS